MGMGEGTKDRRVSFFSHGLGEMGRPQVQGSMRASGGRSEGRPRQGSRRRGCYGEAGHAGRKLSPRDTEDF